MSSTALRVWMLTHKWTSLVCTAFLLVICVTSIPLVFHEEIFHAFGEDEPAFAEFSPDAPRADVDAMVAAALARLPGGSLRGVSISNETATVNVTVGVDAPRGRRPVQAGAPGEAPNAAQGAAPAGPPRQTLFVFDARNGELLRESAPGANNPAIPVVRFMLSLHRDLFLGLPGALFMGFMGVLFIVSIVSGVVVYAPFMKKLDFGTVRKTRSKRAKWLDLHNLVGVTTVAWAITLAFTGAVIELSSPLLDLWRANHVAPLIAPFKDAPPPAGGGSRGSVQAAIDKAEDLLPDNRVANIFPPGGRFGVDGHYNVRTLGSGPFSAYFTTPVLVNIATGETTGVVEMPWYIRLLELSRVLHFGESAGIPLKTLYSLFSVASIVVIGSGLYLWLTRRKARADAEARPGKAKAVLAPEPAQ